MSANDVPHIPTLSNHDTPQAIALVILCFSVLWTTFLVYDRYGRRDPPRILTSLRLYLHVLPALFSLITTVIAHSLEDTALAWFLSLVIFRYWRTTVNIFFWFRYKPTLPSSEDKWKASDCTVIVPTVGPQGNDIFNEMVVAILVNEPRRLIFSTNTEEASEAVNTRLRHLCVQFEKGLTQYQQNHGFGPMKCTTEIEVINANISSKRQQVVSSFGHVDTDILVMVDDTAIWHPRFLHAALPAFNDDKVGIVGTRKWVKRIRSTVDPKASLIKNLITQYWSGFWNTMGGLYLIRHNFEIRATNAADGGVFCVSGRTCLIRSRIVNHEEFKHAFLNEYVLRLGDYFPGWGPVNADDDVFITRWVINHGWKIKIQWSEEATITTVLGKLNPLKFPDQCKRWSRTTFRQNPISLFSDRTVWWEWPLTTWTTIIPWLYNAALIWDGLAIYTLLQTKLYMRSEHPRIMLCCLIAFIWLSKLVKTSAWFWAYPADFWLYFVIPAYPLFVYYHSCLKIWTALTFWDLTWSGRKLPVSQDYKER